jgi:hypothetical protein
MALITLAMIGCGRRGGAERMHAPCGVLVRKNHQGLGNLLLTEPSHKAQHIDRVRKRERLGGTPQISTSATLHSTHFHGI